MTRVATFQNNQSALLNLQRAQSQETNAANAVSSGKKAHDLKGFGRAAESIAALKTVQSKVEGWLGQGAELEGRLEFQDIMLNRTGEAAEDARLAIGDALAFDRGEGLMAAMEAAFSKAAESLNAKHDGRFLFAGARLEETPFAADRLSDLTAAADLDDLFKNDALKATSRLGESTVVQTGELASEIGTELMTVFQRVQAFVEANGAFGHPLTAAQKTFLQSEFRSFADAGSGVTAVAARNGAVQRRVDDALTDLGSRKTSVKVLIGDRTDKNIAEAISELQAAQVAVQASAKVFASLRGSSLLDLLPV